MTALIDARGRIRQQLAPDEAGVLDGEVRLLTGDTPFMVMGNWPLLAAGLAAAVLHWRRHAHAARLVGQSRPEERS